MTSPTDKSSEVLPPDFGSRVGATPSASAFTKPQASPLAYVVFIDDDPQGFDYRVFPASSEHEAYTCAIEHEAEAIPLYRAEAFAPSHERAHDDLRPGIDYALPKAAPSSTASPQISAIDKALFQNALNSLATIEEAIWTCTGSAVLSGDGGKGMDRHAVYKILCETGNHVAWVRGELEKIKGERSAIASREQQDDAACKRAADILRAEVKRLDYPKGVIPQEADRIDRRQKAFEAAIKFLDPEPGGATERGSASG